MHLALQCSVLLQEVTGGLLHNFSVFGQKWIFQLISEKLLIHLIFFIRVCKV